jgi:hypothetical protein
MNSFIGSLYEGITLLVYYESSREPHPPIIFILVAAREKLKYSLRKNALSCPGRRQALEHI